MKGFTPDARGMSNLSFLDTHPRFESLRTSVMESLTARPRRIASKFLYDQRGSELFDQICAQPEYYQTASELEILSTHGRAMLGGTGRTLIIELGSGHGRKIRQLLATLQPGDVYVPIDISHDYLLDHAARLAADFPALHVAALCADFLQPWQNRLETTGYDNRIVFFPGSTLGNFEPQTQQRIMTHAVAAAGPGGRLLIGLDRKNDRTVLEAAYNDAARRTAEFELNVLRRINRELGADFDLTGFTYVGFYNAVAGRIEMYLESLREQTVTIEGMPFTFAANERIHIENSYKFEAVDVRTMCGDLGLRLDATWTSTNGLFNVFGLTVEPR